MHRRNLLFSGVSAWTIGGIGSLAAVSSAIAATPACSKPLYLSFDTGHMGIADLVAEVLNKHKVPVTFFAANEVSKQGGSSLSDFWAPWWRARSQEGHAMASHTFDHMYWQADLRSAEDDKSGRRSVEKGNAPVTHFRVKPSAGPRANQSYVVSAQEYCSEIERAAQRLQQMTGHKPLPLYRAPGGKTSPALLAAAEAAGYKHVGWSPAGFLGDELPSEKYPNDKLLRQALANIRSGDILLAHLGIWSRKDPWAPAVLEPLILGLLDKGFCFQTLAQHPVYKNWIAQHPGRA